MKKKIYCLNFNDNLGTRDQITSLLDSNRDKIPNWYYCMTNTIFIVSFYTAKELAEFIKKLDKDNVARFFVQEIIPNSNSWGFLPQDAHSFINKYVSQ